jgi:hypothetical protein
MGVKERPFCRFWIGPTVERVLTLEGLHEFENEDIGSMQYLGGKTNQ